MCPFLSDGFGICSGRFLIEKHVRENKKRKTKKVVDIHEIECYYNKAVATNSDSTQP